MLTLYSDRPAGRSFSTGARRERPTCSLEPEPKPGARNAVVRGLELRMRSRKSRKSIAKSCTFEFAS